MFTKSSIESKLDAEITTLLIQLAETPDKHSEEYANLVNKVFELQKIKSEDRPKQLSPDTMLLVAANIFGIVWLTRYERENVIKSKAALGFVTKPR